MAYNENRQVIRYSMDQITMTSTDKTRAFIGPKGRKGTLLDYGIDGISTTTAGGTNTPQVKVGTVGTSTAYGAAFDVGALTAPNAKSVASTYRPTDTAFYSTYITNDTLAADTLFVLTCVAATGSGAAGVGNPYCVVAWDD